MLEICTSTQVNSAMCVLHRDLYIHAQWLHGFESSKQHPLCHCTSLVNDFCLCTADRERVTVTNFASTMVTLLVSNPLLPQLDLSCLRLVSCGGSPLPPPTVKRAIAAFGCPFFISYGMTECCGKISMSILPKDCSQLRYIQQRLTCCNYIYR